MNATVWFATDPFDKNSWTPVETDDPREPIFERFGESGFPANTRIYHEVVSEETDVTPHDPATVADLGKMQGDVWVVTYPHGPIGILIAAIAIAVVAIVLTDVSEPAVTVGTQSQSTNNSLSRRGNTGRPLQRVPDIFGTVRAIPDLLALPYTTYEDNIEVEISTMCIGRGDHDVEDVRDGETPISQINGASVAVYGPGDTPNNGATPKLQIGTPIAEPVQIVTESNSVNGQELVAQNAFSAPAADVTPQVYSGSGDAVVVQVELQVSDPLTTFFTIGDVVDIPQGTGPGNIRVDYPNPEDPGVTLTGALGGQGFIVSAIDTIANTLTFSNGLSVQPNWEFTEDPAAILYDANTSINQVAKNVWIGPFTFTPTPAAAGGSDTHELLFNFVARNGLYTRGNAGQSALNVEIEVEITALDESGTPLATPAQLTETFTLVGSAIRNGQIALTGRVSFPDAPRLQFRARRITDTPPATGRTVVDTVQWQEAYLLTLPSATDFGNVTIVQSRTVATEAATGVRERRLNMLASRLVPRYVGNDVLPPATSTRFSDILIAVTTDELIGRRGVDDLNLSSILAVADEIDEYFGDADHSQFSFTFDALDFTYEQTVASIAQAVYCSAFRQGSVLDLTFDRPGRTPSILFNHRNKVLQSERRTLSFGNVNSFDGVELEYIDPLTDVTETFFVPEDRSSINPQQIKTVGVRNVAQARAHAYRARNRQRFQFVATEFTASGEGNLLVPRDVILVADNTRPAGDDGEIVNVLGLTVQVSQPVRQPEPGENLVMHLQYSDRTTGNVQIASVSNDGFFVTLAQAPEQAPITGGDRYTKTTYLVTSDAGERIDRFILTDVQRGQTLFESTVSAIQYDERYYQDDLTGS